MGGRHNRRRGSPHNRFGNLLRLYPQGKEKRLQGLSLCQKLHKRYWQLRRYEKGRSKPNAAVVRQTGQIILTKKGLCLRRQSPLLVSKTRIKNVEFGCQFYKGKVYQRKNIRKNNRFVFEKVRRHSQTSVFQLREMGKRCFGIKQFREIPRHVLVVEFVGHFVAA